MSTSVVKRTGESFVIGWSYDVAHESQIDEFRIESSDSPTGTFAVVVGGLPVSSRTKALVAGTQNKYFRVAAVKGSNASYGGNLVQVIIDNTPFPPEDVTVE
jgi:hypothetical protein